MKNGSFYPNRADQNRKTKSRIKKIKERKKCSYYVMLKLRFYIADFFSKQIQKTCKYFFLESCLQWALLNFEGKL